MITYLSFISHPDLSDFRQSKFGWPIRFHMWLHWYGKYCLPDPWSLPFTPMVSKAKDFLNARGNNNKKKKVRHPYYVQLEFLFKQSEVSDQQSLQAKNAFELFKKSAGDFDWSQVCLWLYPKVSKPLNFRLNFLLERRLQSGF